MTNLGKPRASGIDGANFPALEEVNASQGPGLIPGEGQRCSKGCKTRKSLTYSPTAPTNFSNCCLFVGQG